MRRKKNCTCPVQRAIGVRRRPDPQGRTGFIRIDTVHQEDKDGEKGLYHINAVDEVTQFEVVCSVECISEMLLIPVLEEILAAFLFKLLEFLLTMVLSTSTHSGQVVEQTSHCPNEPHIGYPPTSPLKHTFDPLPIILGWSGPTCWFFGWP